MKRKQGIDVMEFADCHCFEPGLNELLPLYLAGDVTQDQSQKIEKHVAACPECRDQLLFWMAMSDKVTPSDKRPKSR